MHEDSLSSGSIKQGFIIRNPDAEKIADESCILQFKYFPG